MEAVTGGSGPRLPNPGGNPTLDFCRYPPPLPLEQHHARRYRNIQR